MEKFNPYRYKEALGEEDLDFQSLGEVQRYAVKVILSKCLLWIGGGIVLLWAIS